MKPHARKEIHVVLDNLSTHTTPEVKEWLAKNPHVQFNFTSVGFSWLNQIEIWFRILTRQSIRRGTFSSVNVLIKQIRDYINSWSESAKPFTWTATAGEALAKVLPVATNVKKLAITTRTDMNMITRQVHRQAAPGTTTSNINWD